MTDATTTDQKDTAEAAARLRSKNGVPKLGLVTIDSYAQKIWGAARKADVAPVIIARAITGRDDSMASGGTWAKRLGALRLYNVVDKGADGVTVKLSPLGIALSNTTDEAAHSRALKDAVLGVAAYAQVLTRYDGGSLPETSIVASEYEYAYELSKKDAAEAAKTFVDSAKYAGLVNDDGQVNLAGVTLPDLEQPAGEITPPSNNGAPGASPAAPATPPAAPQMPRVNVDTTPSVQNVPPTPAVQPLPAGAAPVALSVKLDMSGWAVEDVLRVLDALGYEGTSRESV
ncbi:hypothetical protein [Microbacterium suaedae]|uniref:hypothetical protein n=1 Tax=Microbacterium suaedae TaxID=2067813 RepID=UPI000DA12D8E|nr:hypothetical protein [Microbacterium suaedae]